jgi:hypothetical protein
MKGVVERNRTRAVSTMRITQRVIAAAEAAIANSRNAAQEANAKSNEAKDRIARLQRGEDRQQAGRAAEVPLTPAPADVRRPREEGNDRPLPRR